MEGDERCCHIMSTPLVPGPPSSIPDKMAFVAPSSSRPTSPTGSKFFGQHFRKPSHTIDQCFDLHPELR